MVQAQLLSLYIYLGIFLPSVLADMSIQTFESPGCQGRILSNPHPIPANVNEDSGCVALGGFQAVGIPSADPGYQCNVYSDSACKNFVAGFGPGFVGSCTNVIGFGVRCFSQASFDNPLSGTVVEVEIGTKFILYNGGPNPQVFQAVTQSCGERACDPSNLFMAFTKQTSSDCDITISMDGDYDNANQRDYMAALLAKAMSSAMITTTHDDTLFTFTTTGPTFGKVVLNDRKGANRASMTATYTRDCGPQDTNPCDNILAKVTKAALSEVPGVGGLFGLLFDIACV